MLFWKKDKTRDIRDTLTAINKRIKDLKTFEKRKDKTLQTISEIKSFFIKAKQNILERAVEEKAKPWIDARFDKDIENMANKELEFLNKLSSDLDIYFGLVNESSNEEDMNSAIASLIEEENKIVKRDEENHKLIDEMAKATLKDRMTRAFETLPNRSTSDHVPWRDIATVARQFGCFVEGAGTHAFTIRAPNNTRPIPLSSDVRSEELARQLKLQLRNSLPEYKIPNVEKLTAAFKGGDIRLAA